MPDTSPSSDLTNNKSASQFEMDFDEGTAFIEYVVQDDKYHLTHTEVPKELQGKGAARKLVEKVLQYIKDKNMRVVPSCTYVARYIDRNQQWHSLLSDGYQM
ncbi:MAG: N-acetyltransferase [Flavobacterium sp.]|nr:N-acetyltransferase [Flavobacterium sp.]